MILVDANVLLDVLTNDPAWTEWSRDALARGEAEGLAINPIIFAEIAPAFRSQEEIVPLFAAVPLQKLPLPYAAAWPAAKAFVEYRRRGGVRTAPLPDFFIGAHAQVEGLRLLTRDAARFRTYFPEVALICPA